MMTAVNQVDSNTTSSTRRKSRPGKNTSPAQDRLTYANAIDAYSKTSASHSLYAGIHFENLAGYLQQPYEARAPELVSRNFEAASSRIFEFVTLYDLSPADASSSNKVKTKSFSEIEKFETEASELLAQTNHGQLLFMQGHPSPEWLLAIGSMYDIDPAFFQRHLKYRLGDRDFFDTPSLPSSSALMVSLRLSTIGWSRVDFTRRGRQASLDVIRAQISEATTAYHQHLRGSESNLGDSIVRDCLVHDMRHLTIEQDISVNVKRTSKSWIGLIWLDNGADLNEGLTSWLTTLLQGVSRQMSYLPILQYQPSVGIKRLSKLTAPLTGTSGAAKVSQSASLLHRDYGVDMNADILGSDSFYALHHLFQFAAFSDIQLLNMLESKLNSQLDQTVFVQEKDLILSNILCHQQSLDRHIQRIEHNIISIKSRSLVDWPRGTLTDALKAEADAAASSLLRDYEYLLGRAKSISRKCDRGIQIVLNNIAIKESQKAISQAEGVIKLTRLAFIFIPLSFTATFFGMNFVQFGTGVLHIWIWFTVSAPILILSLLSVKYDLLDMLKSQLSSKDNRASVPGGGERAKQVAEV